MNERVLEQRTANNPVCTGFYPDASILRVGSDYYMATSTFEWVPGIALLHSRDMVHWETLPSAIQESAGIDLEGIDTACGVWAPNLTWVDGTFYLMFSVVYTATYRLKDTHNYLMKAKDIRGPWSKPQFVNCSGFDPSLFHEDGRFYVMNQVMEHRTDRNRFGGVVLQEYDMENGRVVGSPVNIFRGTARGTTESPNIMKHDGWYYLMVAEGGTEYNHCVMVARSRNLWGPYEADPNGPMLSSTGTDCALQRAGHGQLVKDPQGRWYLAHLCARPIDGKWSVLGREAAIQNICWRDGWPRLDASGIAPSEHFCPPEAPVFQVPEEPEVFTFENGIPDGFMTLRRGWERCGMTLEQRPGWLRVYGGNSLCSRYRQALIAHRITDFVCDAEVCMEFDPRCSNHMAGLVCYYNCDNYHYLAVSRNEDGLVTLTVTTCENKELTDVWTDTLGREAAPLFLRAGIRYGKLRFFFSRDGENYEPAGEALDMTILSDERVEGNGFSGSMVGFGCQDLQGDGVFADFRMMRIRNASGTQES